MFLVLILFLLAQTYSLFLQVEAIQSIIPVSCHNTCGKVPIKYPFGSSLGCGHPAFSKYIKCSSGTLHLNAASIYTISSIDYSTNTLVITDPLMSTCSSMQNSGSFVLDGASPFTVMEDNIFVLVGCSRTSPVFDPDVGFCDKGSGLKVCEGLYSCRGVEGIGLEPNAPISTCCVYDPLVSEFQFRLDVPKLQCSSYTSIYGFGGDEGDPMRWEYGISLQFNGSYTYSDACRNCEDSGGFCGFSGLGEAFSCKCQNGFNTTTNCYGRGNAASRHKIHISLTIGGFLLSWMIACF